MDDKNEFKKYFVKDAELISIDQDKLDYKDIVKNLETIIDNTEPPLTIALTGKSGAGKSSIINFLSSRYKANPDKYNVTKINVWKNKTSIKDYLESEFEKIDYSLVDAENVENEEEQTIDENEEESKFINDNKNKKKTNKKFLKIILAICNTLLTFVACFFVTSIIFVLMEYFSNRDIYKRNDIFFVENTYLNYSENLGLIMLFSLVLASIAIVIYKLFKHKGKKAVKVNGSDSDYQSDEEYEEYEEDNLEQAVPKKKNIILIEDIDKLSVAKMLKVLEEIRFCNEYQDCVFIVTLEKNALKKAIEVRNEIKASAKYKPLRFEKVFDKIFQFKIHIPQIPYSTFKEYAVNLVQESMPDFIEEYCEMEVFESVIRNILIYKNVTTPRHVKKLLNNFVNNKLLAYNKFESGDIDEDFIKGENFDFQLAKISVLQADFEEFYDLIFKDFSYLDKLTELYCLSVEEIKEKYNDIDEELKPFFKAKYKSLRNFLRQTRNYTIDEIVTLMYLTKNTSEKLYKGRPISSYVIGDENLSNWSNYQVLELIKSIKNKNDLSEFTKNNFKYMLENYERNVSDEVFFSEFNDNLYEIEEYISKEDYLKYLKLVAINYEFYPEEAIQVFKYSKVEFTWDIMNIILRKLENDISENNYQDIFEIIRDNSDCFYEEEGNISEYVAFLVDYIKLSQNPDEVITELDENFTRIGKVYELNNNIKNLDNLDYDKAYGFIGKCLDNGDLERMTYVTNKILSDEDSIRNCLKIEEKMRKYSLVDVVECNVDSIIEIEANKLGINADIDGSDNNEKASSEPSEFDNNLIENNYTLLKNLVEICVIKQIYINATDVMKIVERALDNVNDDEYILSIYEILNKLDRMYFYEIRRDFNEIIYRSFHTAKNDDIRLAALGCTRYFKNTRLFKTKLTEEEEQFYSAN